jgi:hypothetical protein
MSALYTGVRENNRRVMSTRWGPACHSAFGPTQGNLGDLHDRGSTREIVVGPPEAADAVDEALTSKRNAPLLILRGDVFVEHDPGAAAESWRDALEIAHPDSVFAVRARARLETRHPYRTE